MAANRTLQNLIIASGYSGSSGQSFRNHVTGAATGVKMSDYNVTDWSFDSAGAPPPIGEQTGYSSGQVFNLTFHFTEGTMAHYIRRKGSAVIAASASVSSGEGADVEITTDVNDTTTGTAALTLISRINPAAQIDNVVAWFDGYVEPALPPDGPQNVSWEASTSTGPGSGQETRTIDLTYTVDIGGYNGSLSKQYDILMNDRAVTTDDFDIEWSEDGGSTVANTGPVFSWTQGHQGEDKTVHYRYRITGTITWSSWTPATFTDPRDEV